MARQEDLSREIARLTCRFKSIDEVDCVYLTPYVDSHGVNMYDMTVVVTTKEYRDLVDKLIVGYNAKNEEREIVEKYDGVLSVKTAKPDNYSTRINEFSSEEEIETAADMFSSVILFDRYGFYTRVAHQFDAANKSDDPKAIKMREYSNSIPFFMDKSLMLEFEPLKNQQ